MELIKGKEIAENILMEIKEKISFKAVKPEFAVILVGDNEASRIYVELKEKASKRVGINFRKILFSKDVSEDKVIKKIKELNTDKKVSGIIVQLPLPNNLNKENIINTISVEKDVDGFHQKNQHLFLENKDFIYPVFPKAIVRMIEDTFEKKKEEEKLKAVIVCKSSDFGIIMKKALEKIGLNAEFIFCEDLQKKRKNDNYTRLILGRADIVVSACGIPKLLKENMVKNKAIIIDGGITKKDGKVFGDVDITSFSKTNCKISPVPGGVGPVTVATLLENVYLVSEKQE